MTTDLAPPAMPRHRVRRWIGPVLVVAVVVLGALQILPPLQRADVAVPSPDASPEEVVLAYLQAIDAHDCGTADALATPSFTETTSSFCRESASLTITELTTPDASNPAAVHADFDIDWRFLHADPSIPEGEYGWTYYLTRAPAGWRVSDAGNG